MKPGPRGSITGKLPKDWLEDSSWADVDVQYTRSDQDPFAGKHKLLIKVDAIRKGRVQLRNPSVALDEQRALVVRMAVRSSKSSSLELSVRQSGHPYKKYSSKRVTTAPEWRTVELVAPPRTQTKAEPRTKTQFMIGLDHPGEIELDQVEVFLVPLSELGGVTQKGNLLPSSSFPDGLPAPWTPFHGPYTPGQYVTDAEVLGPTGVPALRVTPRWSGGHYVTAITSPFQGPAGRAATFSFWARTETAGKQINIRIGPADAQLWTPPYQKTVALTKEWKRYEHTVTLPITGEGVYLARIMNWGPQGVFWVDGMQVEAGERAGEFERAGGPVELTLQPEQPYGLSMGNEPVKSRWSLVGEWDEPVTIAAELFDHQGNATPLESWLVEPNDKGWATGTVSIDQAIAGRFGSFRIEARVVGKSATHSTRVAEALVHRVRKPRGYGKKLPNSAFGIHIRPNAEMPGVFRKLGFTWVRHFGMGWASVEREPGEWVFDDADKVVGSYDRANLMVLGILGGPPARVSYAPKDTPPGYNAWHKQNALPKDLEGWGEYVRRMTERYAGRVDYWESWNEPFLPGFLNKGWKDGKYIHPPAKEFLPFHQKAVEAAARGNPNAKVIFNAGAHYWSPSDAWTIELLKKPVMHESSGIVSYHEYEARGVGFEGDAIEKSAEAHLAHVEGIELWNSEGGHGPSVLHNYYRHTALPTLHRDVDRWSAYHVKYYLSSIANRTGKFFLYTAHGWGAWKPDYSVLNADGRLSPSMTAISNLAWHIESMRFVKRAPLRNGVDVYLFEAEAPLYAVGVVIPHGGKGQGWVWDGEDKRFSVRDLYGNPVDHATSPHTLPTYLIAEGMEADTLLAALFTRDAEADERLNRDP